MGNDILFQGMWTQQRYRHVYFGGDAAGGDLDVLEREGDGVDRFGITYGENRCGCGAD